MYWSSCFYFSPILVKLVKTLCSKGCIASLLVKEKHLSLSLSLSVSISLYLSLYQELFRVICFYTNTRFHVVVISNSEKVMAPHSSTLVWKIPWAEEPGRLQSMGSLRVGHNWVTSLSLFTFVHWRRKWQPTPVFLPGESQGQGCLVGCRLWGRTELDTTEAT